MEHMGLRIRELRKSKMLTIQAVSKRLGISSSFLGLIERGERSTSNENIAKLCNMFNVSFEYLAFGKEKDESAGYGFLANMELNGDELDFVMEAAKTAAFYQFTRDELELLRQGMEIHAKSISRVRAISFSV